jgi:hypothetical protein
LVGQSGRRAHLDFVLGTGAVPAGGSIYAELYTGKPLSFEQEAFVDYLHRHFAGSLVEVGLSWKENRVSAGYCDLALAACVAAGGAIAPELDIVAGKYDAQLSAFGAWMQSYDSLRFLVRVDYEVSPLLHCGPADVDDCPAYRDAFAHIKALWKSAGISNVELVFHPTRGWARQMYPGADLTDWIAFSVFNHDVCLPTPEGNNGACAPGQRLDPNLSSDLEWARAQHKPILIAEATVQSPSDSSASGFNEYLSRLFELVERAPALSGLTYINMKWSGGWVYGENWTVGAFGNVDARIARFPETRSFFCDRLVEARYASLGGARLGCDRVGELPLTLPLTLPGNLDAATHERLVLLGSNGCASIAQGSLQDGTAIVQQDCASLAGTGRSRFHVDASATGVQIWSDVSWLCWSAEAQGLVQRPCADVPEQRFSVVGSLQGSPPLDVGLRASDGRCVEAPADAAAGKPLNLASCSASAQQLIRL